MPSSNKPNNGKGRPKGSTSTARDRRKKAFEHVEDYKYHDQPKPYAPRGTRSHSKRMGAVCNANKKVRDGGEKGSRGKCQLAAGFGTNHPGVGRCKYHGGSSPTHVASAAGGEMRKLLGEELELNPFEAIMWCIRIRAGEIKWLSDRMADLDEQSWIEDTLVGKQFHLYARERQHAMNDLTRFSQIAISMGIAERYVRLAETYGQTIAKLIQGILGELNLTEEQQLIAPKAIRKHLLLVEGGAEIVEGTSRQKVLDAAKDANKEAA